MERPSEADAERAARALRVAPVAWRPVTRGGQTAASRWVATLPDGTTRFVKIAHTDDTASWIRDEHLFYALAGRRAYLPEFLGWRDDGARPVLVLEDLSEATWPPPWTAGEVRGGAAMPAARWPTASRRPTCPTPATASGPSTPGPRSRPTPNRSCGSACARRRGSSGTSTRCRRRRRPPGSTATALLHFDVRSDNLCLREGRAVLIDWNFACLGNPVFDVAAWLPSLHAEGGPAPEHVLDTTDEVACIASLLAGNFGWRGAQADIAEAPHVRPLQRKQAATALPWAARALGLPPPLD